MWRHGLRPRGPKSPEYSVWSGLRSRCLAPANRFFADYGGRGITVCARWDSFEKFLADMGARPTPRHSIDRIDVNGNYEPSNCRWATHEQQQRNRRSTKLTEDKVRTIRVLIEGGESNVAIARRFKVTSSTISYIRSGHTWKRVA